jgi:hypothetical protein
MQAMSLRKVETDQSVAAACKMMDEDLTVLLVRRKEIAQQHKAALSSSKATVIKSS